MKRIHLTLFALTLAFSIHADATASTEPRAVAENVYTLFAVGDMEGFAALMSPDIVRARRFPTASESRLETWRPPGVRAREEKRLSTGCSRTVRKN